MSDYLMHHGIKGQRWGVRRQRPSTLGSSFSEKSNRREAAMRRYHDEHHQLTRAGKRRDKYRRNLAKKYGRQVREIVDTMPDKEKRWLNDDGDDLAKYGVVANRTIVKNLMRTPVSYIDLIDTGHQAEIDIGTRAGNKYRGKGYATRAAKRGIRWYEKHKDDEGWSALYWNVYKDNVASQKLAEKLGFEKTQWEGDKIYQYVRN